MKKHKTAYKTYNFFLILFFFTTTILSLSTLRKLDFKDIKLSGSKLFSTMDILENSSLNYETPLLFIKTKYLEEELKKNLSLENISVRRQIIPFGLRILIKTRTPIAYGERLKNGKKIYGFIDKYGIFINEKFAEKRNQKDIKFKVFGWQDKFKNTLSEIINLENIYKIELVEISFSQSGYVTLKEKDLKTIFLGFNSSFIKSQMGIINSLKEQLEKNEIPRKIDSVDLTDPTNPIIKVFKP